MAGIGIISAFNKGMSGGGYGPLVTGGQILAGHNYKCSICNTVLAEAPICIAGFLTYLATKGISDWKLVGFLSLGALLGAPIGALLTKKLQTKKSVLILAVIIAILGAWTLYKTWM